MSERVNRDLADIAPQPSAAIGGSAWRGRIEGQRPVLALHGGQLRRAAKRRLPRPIFDYLEGGANDEVTLRRNRAAFQAVHLRQRVFDHAPVRNARTQLFGQTADIPVGIAPVGMGGVFYPRAEICAARAAAAFGVPYCLSTLASCSIEDVAAAAGTPFLFQLYMMKDHALNADLLKRAAGAGCPALVINVDTAVQGRRNRDLDNGLVVPLKVRPQHVVDLIRKPPWLCGWLLNKPTLGNLAPYCPDGGDLAAVSVWAESRFKGAVTVADLEWLRHAWPHRLVVKGVLDPDDAKLAVKIGADALVISNHGGRQLDGAASTIGMLPRVRDAVGNDVELILDSGVRSGYDVLKALALGANGCLLGRAIVYGLAAYGQAGVGAALRLIAQELEEVMILTGTADVNALPEDLVPAFDAEPGP